MGAEDNGGGDTCNVVLSLYRGREWTQFAQSPWYRCLHWSDRGRQRPPVTIDQRARERGKSHGHSTETREWRARFTRTFSSLVGVRAGSLARDSSVLRILFRCEISRETFLRRIDHFLRGGRVKKKVIEYRTLYSFYSATKYQFQNDIPLEIKASGCTNSFEIIIVIIISRARAHSELTFSYIFCALQALQDNAYNNPDETMRNVDYY